jgi:NhaA family Na+:H+ antiporter
LSSESSKVRVLRVKPSPISEHDHVLGPTDAAVTLIEYGDYECPFCVKAYPVIESVRTAFAGKLRFVYRHVPKSAEHAFAKQAAEASEFAASQGKFWEIHAQLFLHADRHDLDYLVEAAKTIGLDAEACRTALVERSFAARVRELAVASVRSGIVGTPTLFINGSHYQDRMEEGSMRSAVSRALEAMKPN